MGTTYVSNDTPFLAWILMKRNLKTNLVFLQQASNHRVIKKMKNVSFVNLYPHPEAYKYVLVYG
jgi:hypothetical protein